MKNFKELLTEKPKSELKEVQALFKSNKIKEIDSPQMGMIYEGKVMNGYIIAGRANGPLEADVYLKEADAEDADKLMTIFIKK